MVFIWRTHFMKQHIFIGERYFLVFVVQNNKKMTIGGEVERKTLATKTIIWNDYA